MQGCDNFCSYCVVPYSRGKEQSREPRLILAEIADVVSRGCREVTLLGQNVNAYRGRDVSGAAVDFPELLRRVDAVAGVERIRFATSHPRDISDRLAAALRDLERVCEQLHFPVQSGSDAVLARMNRGYTRQDYLDRVAGLRQAVPGIALFSDLIVGFPGETDEDFAATIALLETARFDRVYAFAYSPRPSTAAASLPDDVPAEVKAARLREVLRRQREISREINRSFLGETVEVLVEERNLRFGDRGGGKTRGGTPVFFPWEEGLIGQLIRVRVERAKPASLYGKRLRKDTGNRQPSIQESEEALE
jgi:tRNA-2-methylthio-N6-dimethylallyladenosine synthase